MKNHIMNEVSSILIGNVRMAKAKTIVRALVIYSAIFLALTGFAQVKKDTLGTGTSAKADIFYSDTTKTFELNEVVVSASRTSESRLRSPVSIEQLQSDDAVKMGSPTVFDAIENVKGVQIITPSLGFKVINTRGFANTTNVRFSQLVDGIDNQAPHIDAPIANALGANDLDIDNIEIIPGTASALYGMNAINGLANIRTKNPFASQGLSLQQLTGVNHVGAIDNFSPQLYRQTNVRFAKSLSYAFAFKINGSLTSGKDWVADNRTDLASTLNSSTALFGQDNPAFDEVNGYGNESSNRRTLSLNNKQYVVARTGYREVDIADYNLQNIKGDIGLFYRPKIGQQVSLVYKGALINDIYQRSNRFRLQDYTLQQYSIDYQSEVLTGRAYLTRENTGKSYNLRSLAENMDRAFKSDDQWFADYKTAYNNAIASQASVAEAHRAARVAADRGRFIPGTDAFKQKQDELTDINNWDYGAALRVQASLLHTEGLLNWDKLWAPFFEQLDAQLLSGFDYRTYIIVPDGNYFINPVDSTKDLTYGKAGGFVQLNKNLFGQKVRLGATIRADKADYFDWKFNPRITAVFSPEEELNFRTSYQTGYRFPSIFEGFSNVNSGGVKRVGGLRIMSNGIFENSYTKASIDTFQARVTGDINTLSLTQAQAIAKNSGILQKNPYTYLQPEYIRSFEIGISAIAIEHRLSIDADVYYNSYDNFIAQVEASIPNTTNPDSIPSYLYSKSKQKRYRLWTNSQTRIFNYGGSLGLKYKYDERLTFLGNVSYSHLDRTENKDGLEDGYNTPTIILNATVISENLWKRLGASLTYRYQSSFNYVSFLVNGEVPEYRSMDAQINYNFEALGIVAKLGATDLLNKTYYSMLGGSSVGGLYYLSLTYSLVN